ncbi:MAG: hypothetical protein KF745_13790 [Phycisphaeraceae bacterium]|nr:hypothetical protein [Phycisphaeraceae bacterium]
MRRSLFLAGYVSILVLIVSSFVGMGVVKPGRFGVTLAGGCTTFGWSVVPTRPASPVEWHGGRGTSEMTWWPRHLAWESAAGVTTDVMFIIPVWPGGLLVLPEVLCWMRMPRRRRDGCCHVCGYDLCVPQYARNVCRGDEERLAVPSHIDRSERESVGDGRPKRYRWLGASLVLVVAPWRLAEVAARMSPWGAVFVGIMCAGWLFGMWVSSDGTAAAEPFPTMLEYFGWVGFYAVLIGGVLIVAPALALMGVAALMLRLVRAIRKRRGKGMVLGPVGSARIAVVALSPLWAVAPMTVLGYAVAAIHVRDRSFGMWSKPGWVYSQGLDVATSPAWQVVVAVAAVGFGVLGLKRVGKIAGAREDGPRCGGCGYSMVGLGAAAEGTGAAVVCPECGSEQVVASRNADVRGAAAPPTPPGAKGAEL